MQTMREKQALPRVLEIPKGNCGDETFFTDY